MGLKWYLKTRDQHSKFRRTIFDPRADIYQEVIFRVPFFWDAVREKKYFSHHEISSDLSKFDGKEYLRKAYYNMRLPEECYIECLVSNMARKAGFKTPQYIFFDKLTSFVEVAENEGEFNYRALKRLHNIKGFGGFGSVNRYFYGVFKTWKEYICCCLDRNIYNDLGPYNFSRVSNSDMEIRKQIIGYVKMIEYDGPPCLLHGDLSPDNIIGDSVIDWDSAVFGDPIFELASACCFYPEEQHKQIIDQYYGEDERPKDFWFNFWAYYLRIAVSRVIIKMRRRDKNLRAERIDLALERLGTLV